MRPATRQRGRRGGGGWNYGVGRSGPLVAASHHDLLCTIQQYIQLSNTNFALGGVRADLVSPGDKPVPASWPSRPVSPVLPRESHTDQYWGSDRSPVFCRLWPQETSMILSPAPGWPSRPRACDRGQADLPVHLRHHQGRGPHPTYPIAIPAGKRPAVRPKTTSHLPSSAPAVRPRPRNGPSSTWGTVRRRDGCRRTAS